MLEERRAKVVALLQQGATNGKVALDLAVTDRSVRRWRRNWRAYGDCVAPRTVVQGRPRLLTCAEVDVSVVAPVSEVS